MDQKTITIQKACQDFFRLGLRLIAFTALFQCLLTAIKTLCSFQIKAKRIAPWQRPQLFPPLPEGSLRLIRRSVGGGIVPLRAEGGKPTARSRVQGGRPKEPPK